MNALKNKNVKIAVTVLLSIALLYWGIEYLKGVNIFTPANFYYAKFESVDGLVEAAPVTVNGFKVGQIREIQYNFDENNVIVMLSMNKQMKIPVGSQVSIQSNITGAATLELQLSKNSTFLKVGDEIRGVNPPGLMDNVTDNVMPTVASILPKVDSIMTSLNTLLGSPHLAASVARLDAITAELAQSSRQLTMMMNSLNKSVPTVMTNVNGITSNLGDASGNINQFTTSLNKIPLDSTVNSLNKTVANLEQLSNQLNSPNSSLGLLLNDKSLYYDADHAITSLDSLLMDIKRNPKRYINIKVF